MKVLTMIILYSTSCCAAHACGRLVLCGVRLKIRCTRFVLECAISSKFSTKNLKAILNLLSAGLRSGGTHRCDCVLPQKKQRNEIEI